MGLLQWRSLVFDPSVFRGSRGQEQGPCRNYRDGSENLAGAAMTCMRFNIGRRTAAIKQEAQHMGGGGAGVPLVGGMLLGSL